MQIDTIKGAKTWGVIALPDKPGHYHTGYVGLWEGSRYIRHKDSPEESMAIGENVVITGDFKIDGMSRGRSAANFNGHFRDHEEVGYQLGMAGTADLFILLQGGWFRVVDGYIRGRWTFAKQGQSVFLMPYGGE